MDDLTGQQMNFMITCHKRVSLFEQSTKTGCVVEPNLIVIHRLSGIPVTLTGTVSPKKSVLKVPSKHYMELHSSYN